MQSVTLPNSRVSFNPFEDPTPMTLDKNDPTVKEFLEEMGKFGDNEAAKKQFMLKAPAKFAAVIATLTQPNRNPSVLSTAGNIPVTPGTPVKPALTGAVVQGIADLAAPDQNNPQPDNSNNKKMTPFPTKPTPQNTRG